MKLPDYLEEEDNPPPIRHVVGVSCQDIALETRNARGRASGNGS